jgi:hypothetical protein
MSGAAVRPELIDGKAIQGLVEARAIKGATVLGMAGGWNVLVRYGSVERVVAAQRSRRARLWRNLNTAAAYVRNELGLPRFEVDALKHDPDAIDRSRPDTAERQRRAHIAVEHERWFRAEVKKAIDEADAADASFIDNAEVASGWRTRREALLRQIGEKKTPE